MNRLPSCGKKTRLFKQSKTVCGFFKRHFSILKIVSSITHYCKCKTARELDSKRWLELQEEYIHRNLALSACCRNNRHVMLCSTFREFQQVWLCCVRKSEQKVTVLSFPSPISHRSRVSGKTSSSYAVDQTSEISVAITVKKAICIPS